MIRFFAFAFLILGFLALGVEKVLDQTNDTILYTFDPTEEAPSQTYLPHVEVHDLDGPLGRVVTWYVPPKRGKPIVVYLHGNAGNLADRTGRFNRLIRAGFGIFAQAYPGSSGSAGSPSEEAIITSMRAGYDWLSNKIGPSQRLVIYGESLGSAVALGLIENLSTAPNDRTTLPTGVILEAPFTSIPDMAKTMFGPPGSFVARFMDDWDSLTRVKTSVDLPLIVVHGVQDQVVRSNKGRAVFDAAQSDKKRLLMVPDANHVNIWSHGVISQILNHMALTDLGL